MGATNRGRNRELGEEKTKETREESFSKREKIWKLEEFPSEDSNNSQRKERKNLENGKGLQLQSSGKISKSPPPNCPPPQPAFTALSTLRPQIPPNFSKQHLRKTPHFHSALPCFQHRLFLPLLPNVSTAAVLLHHRLRPFKS